MQRKVWIALVLMMLSLLGCATAEDAGLHAEAARLVEMWKAQYGEALGWEDGLADVSEPSAEELSKEEVLSLALIAIYEEGKAEETNFAGHRPFVVYTGEMSYNISLLPSDALLDPVWSYFINIDSLTGQVLSLRAVEPHIPTEEDLSDTPKG